MTEFRLHPQIAADTVIICDWPLCRVLLVNDVRFPWIILVPRRFEISEILDLSEQDRVALMGEIARASTIFKSWVSCEKLNIATIGNIVPQLHIHIVARRRTDSLWPQAVWGRGEPVRYAAHELAIAANELRGRFQ